jgi:hypothetical protein
MALGKEKVNYKALFAKLNSKVEQPPKTLFPTQKQHSILDFGGYKNFSNPPAFSSTSDVQEFVNSFKLKRGLFIQKYGKDPCPGHLKMLLDIHGIDYVASEATLTRLQGRKLLKHIYPGDLSSYQIWHFKVKYGIEDDSYGQYSYKTAHTILEEMKTASKLGSSFSDMQETVDELDDRSEIENPQNKFKHSRRS